MLFDDDNLTLFSQFDADLCVSSKSTAEIVLWHRSHQNISTSIEVNLGINQQCLSAITEKSISRTLGISRRVAFDKHTSILCARPTPELKFKMEAGCEALWHPCQVFLASFTPYDDRINSFCDHKQSEIKTTTKNM